jgi:hypothetical protein
MDDTWTPTLRSLADSYQTRVELDLLGGTAGHPGLFAAMFENAKFGTFDVIYDPNNREQIVAGRVVQRENQTYFDTWTSFSTRSAVRNPTLRRGDVVLSDYRISSTLNADLSLDCVTRVKVKPQVDGAHAVLFQITPDMAVSSVTVDGQPAEVLQRESVRGNIGRGGDEVFLVFPSEPLLAGHQYEFEFKHSGKVIQDAGDHVYYVTARGDWYPTHDLQFAQYDLEFRYPTDLDLVAAGDVVEDRTDGDTRITRRRTASAIRFAAFNLGRYEHIEVERPDYVVDVCANRTLENALLPKPPQILTVPITTQRQRQNTVVQVPSQPVPLQNPVDQLQRVAADVATSVDFMVSRFGPPALPHITVSPIPGTFGQGFPGLIYISTLAYLKDRSGQVVPTDSQQLYYDDFLQAHEVAHQWFGNRVTTSYYRDVWLMEALANISALLYVEMHKGEHSAEVMLDTYRNLLLEKSPNGQVTDATGPLTFGPRLESSQAPAAYRTITYGKGIWVMQMLRRRMGDERFLALLLDVVKKYDHREITTDEFRQAAAGYLPARSEDPKLENFFEQWINGTGIPNLKLTYSVKGKAPDLRLVGTVTQSEVDSDFSTLAPVEIEVSRGQTVTKWVRTAAEPVTFTVPLKQAPVKVVLDPHYSVLRKL